MRADPTESKSNTLTVWSWEGMVTVGLEFGQDSLRLSPAP